MRADLLTWQNVAGAHFVADGERMRVDHLVRGPATHMLRVVHRCGRPCAVPASERSKLLDRAGNAYAHGICGMPGLERIRGRDALDVAGTPDAPLLVQRRGVRHYDVRCSLPADGEDGMPQDMRAFPAPKPLDERLDPPNSDDLEDGS